jgi:hypothetical protein
MAVDITDDEFIFVLPAGPSQASAAGLLNPCLGTHLAALTGCTAPDVQVPPDYLLLYVWSQIVQQTGEGLGLAVAVLTATFIRSIGPAIFDYRAACRYVRRYLSHLPQSVAPMAYDLAVARFESCILRIGVAMACGDGIAKIYPALPQHYATSDSSLRERINLFNNRIKNFGDDIVRSSNPGTKLTAPIWITNDGLGCRHKEQDMALSFAELAGLLQEFSGEADRLANGPITTPHHSAVKAQFNSPSANMP